MRIKYKDKDDTFLEKHLVSKEPFGQFKAWFEEACSRKEILEPNAMCLATVSRYVILCYTLLIICLNHTNINVYLQKWISIR